MPEQPSIAARRFDGLIYLRQPAIILLVGAKPRVGWQCLPDGTQNREGGGKLVPYLIGGQALLRGCETLVATDSSGLPPVPRPNFHVAQVSKPAVSLASWPAGPTGEPERVGTGHGAADTNVGDTADTNVCATESGLCPQVVNAVRQSAMIDRASPFRRKRIVISPGLSPVLEVAVTPVSSVTGSGRGKFAPTYVRRLQNPQYRRSLGPPRLTRRFADVP